MSRDDLKKNDTHQPSNETARCILAPALLILASLAMLIYGIAFNSVTILAEKETDKTSTQTVPDDEFPSAQTENIQLSEPDITRDITVGGLVRLSTGVIKRTYTGEPESFCPT